MLGVSDGVTAQGHYFNVPGKDNEDAKGQAGTSRFSRRGLKRSTRSTSASSRRVEVRGDARACVRACVRQSLLRGSLNLFREVVKDEHLPVSFL